MSLIYVVVICAKVVLLLFKISWLTFYIIFKKEIIKQKNAVKENAKKTSIEKTIPQRIEIIDK